MRNIGVRIMGQGYWGDVRDTGARDIGVRKLG